MNLPHEPFSRNEYANIKETLLCGNVLLQQHYQRWKAWLYESTCHIKKTSLTKFGQEVKTKMDAGERPVQIGQIYICSVDLVKIKAVYDLQWRIVLGYGRAITRYANRWAKRSCDYDSAISADDLEQEGCTAVLRASLGYNRSNIQLSTYFFNCINRQMARACVGQSPLSRWGVESVKLYKRYEALVSKLNGHFTFDQIVARLKLSDEECQTLQSMLVRVTRSKPSHEDGLVNSDYSIWAKTIAGLDNNFNITGYNNGNPIYQPSTVDSKIDNDIDMMEYVKDAGLSDFELQVLASMLESGGRGWQLQTARDLINPETNQPYTRMAVNYAIERIQVKLRRVYVNQAA